MARIANPRHLGRVDGADLQSVPQKTWCIPLCSFVHHFVSFVVNGFIS
jgi:hypothetical protein